MLLFSNRSFFHTISFHFSLLYLPLGLASIWGSGNEVFISWSWFWSAPWSNRHLFPSFRIWGSIGPMEQPIFFSLLSSLSPISISVCLGSGNEVFISWSRVRSAPLSNRHLSSSFRIWGSIGPMEQPIMRSSSEYFWNCKVFFLLGFSISLVL